MGAFRGGGCRQRRGCEGETAVWGEIEREGGLLLVLLSYPYLTRS